MKFFLLPGKSIAQVGGMERFSSIATLRSVARDNMVQGCLQLQIEACASKLTREGKPYLEATMADAGDRFVLRVWSDHPDREASWFQSPGSFVELHGEFQVHPQFGLEVKNWGLRELNPEERANVLAGSPENRAALEADEAYVRERIALIEEPRLKALCFLFLDEFGERWKRTAAARTYHHARRGGLVAHTAQMMRASVAICGAYPELNRDLLTAGVLFHDCGKLWENAVEENGFAMPYHEAGEMLGHITIGVELVNRLWKQLMESENAAEWRDWNPPSEQVRLHLLHLVAAHHGSLAFGSPVDPKTPEAWALHFVDNLDAKMEMLAEGYRSSAKLAPRILERHRPLPGNLVLPLPGFAPVESEESAIEAS